MTEQMQTGEQEHIPEPCDLLIVGAGIAGLNALFVATEYLPPQARVILVDRNAAPGGMWTDTYDYVRLHQPHQMFTVGDMPWNRDRPKDYLATGTEVQSHLAHCLSALRQKVDLVELFGHECEAKEEHETPDGPRARVRCRDLIASGAIRDFEAKRLIDAAGWDVPAIQALDLSSENVISTTPGRLSQLDTDPTVPVVIVGGGKTGMDTAQRLIRQTPGRNVTLITGRGTIFGNRDVLFPPAPQRWWRGTMVGTLSKDLTLRFDGTNADAVFDYFRQTYTVSPNGRGEQYFFSMLSQDEATAIGTGVTDILETYLDDVVDTASGPELVFRDGGRKSLPRGSLVINCTGYLMRAPRPYQPFSSALGTTLTITTRSSAYPLSGTAAYFMAHVFFLDKLLSLPLYELDMDSLYKRDKKLFFLTSFTHAYYNMMLIMDNTPLQVFSRCGLDFNRWYPLPRRLLSFADLKRNKKKYLSHCRQNLDRVRLDTGVRCGPLDADRTAP